MRRMPPACLLALLLLAPSAPAQAPVEWTELRRGPVRTREYRVFARKPGGRVEVLGRIHCRPGLTDSAGGAEAMGVARLRLLKFQRESITANEDPPEGRGPVWEINGYIFDCAARTRRHVFQEFYGEGDGLMTRADFRDGKWEPWEELLEELGRRVCG